jgi:hypothetical protein
MASSRVSQFNDPDEFVERRDLADQHAPRNARLGNFATIGA